MLCSFPWNKSIVAQPLFLEDLLPQRLVADNDAGRDIQSRLRVASIRTDVSLSGKIMISGNDEQLIKEDSTYHLKAGDAALHRVILMYYGKTSH